MMIITISYENDRGTPAPEYIKLPKETGLPSHPRLWSINVAHGTQEVESWVAGLTKKLAAPEVAEATLKLEKILGIRDPTDIRDWESKGVELVISNPEGFVNWPDPDLGKGF